MTDTPSSLQSDAQVALVRVGRTGVWGHCWVPEGLTLHGDDWVVCQTGRGSEMGQVRLVRPVVELGVDEVVGSILRVASDSDHLVNQRINRSLAAGIEACNEWLNLHQFDQWVLDVDVPLDGMRLYFHFLGEVDDRLEAATAGLVELFDRVTGVRGFTQAVLVGCGPTCGSDGSGCARTTTPAAGDGEAGGDGLGTAKAGGCQSCALSGGCKQK